MGNETLAGNRASVAFSMTEVQRRVVNSMRRDGIAVVPFAELFQDEDIWTALNADIRQFARETEEQLDQLLQREDGKTYLARRFYIPRTKGTEAKWWTFAAGDRWLQLGLSRSILDVVDSYRGEPTYLIDLDNWYTIPNPDADERVKSQLWHRDPWDNHIVKVFVYFSDVNEDAGPLEYVRGSPAGGRYGNLWPWSPKGIYPPQQEFEAAVPVEDRLTVTGPAGTIIFCDTSGFHRGGWAKTRPRILSYHTYVSPASSKPPRFRIEWSDGAGEPALEAPFAVSWSLKPKYAVSQ